MSTTPQLERTSGTRMDTGDDIRALETIRRGIGYSPELKEGIGCHPVPGGGRVARPGRRADRRPADPRPRPARPGRPRRRVHRDDGAGRRRRDRADQLRVVPDDQPPVHDLRARARHAADQGVPARPRPAAAHPEHRAPRRAGLPGHQRRRPGQPVPRLRRPDLRRQHRPDDGRDGDHAVLQLAARDRRVGLLRAAVPLAALLPAQALRGVRRGPAADRRPAVGDLRAGRRRGRRPRPTRSRTAPRSGSTTRSTSTRRPAPAPRASRRSRSPSAGSRPGWPTPAC